MLHTLRPAPGSTKKRKRVARGNSAGGGTTAGRGTKGQMARTGKGYRYGFEGGQVPLVRRQPKLGGFINPRRVSYEIVKLGDLEKKLEAGTYTVATLRKNGFVHSTRPVKLLLSGELTKKLTLTVNAASEGAVKAIEKAGGSVTIVSQTK